MLEEIVELMAEEELAIAEHKAMLKAYGKIRDKLVLKQSYEENIAEENIVEEVNEIGG